MVQIVEVDCEAFTGSFDFGKVRLEVSGHKVEKEAFLAHCCFIAAVQTDGKDLNISPLPSSSSSIYYSIQHWLLN